jgi:hypothetical protein
MYDKPIDPHFFDLEIYAIYRAIWENWGDEAWKVVWRAGEVLFDEIKTERDLDASSPLTAILPGAERIIAEGGVPAHISTAVMFAGLKQLFGLKAVMIGDPVFTDDGRAIERWKLTKITA